MITWRSSFGIYFYTSRRELLVAAIAVAALIVVLMLVYSAVQAWRPSQSSNLGDGRAYSEHPHAAVHRRLQQVD